MPPAMPLGGAGEIAVPLAALAQPDDQEALVTPGQGDAVSLQVDAQVVRVEGGMAFIKPTAVNGKPLEDEAAEVPEAADVAEGAELRGMAEGM